jgi:molecular chaperone GrpE (heat shock protein)
LNLILDPGEQPEERNPGETPPPVEEKTQPTTGEDEAQVNKDEKTGEETVGAMTDLEEMVSWQQPLPPEDAGLADRADRSLEHLETISRQLARLQETLDSTAKHVSFIPPQVRMLTGKIDAIATTLNESRYQALLLRIVGIYDLVCGMQRGQADSASEVIDEPGVSPPPPPRQSGNTNLEILRTQINQVLDANGLHEIPTEGRFDPQLHYTVGRLMVSDPAKDGVIIDVVRPGFQTETSVLRFAEVRVGYYPYPVEEK